MRKKDKKNERSKKSIENGRKQELKELIKERNESE